MAVSNTISAIGECRNIYFRIRVHRSIFQFSDFRVRVQPYSINLKLFWLLFALLTISTLGGYQGSNEARKPLNSSAPRIQFSGTNLAGMPCQQEVCQLAERFGYQAVTPSLALM
jgi:hypothetical protein